VPLSPAPAFSSPAHSLRLALMDSLFHAHRPELADVVASADLTLDFPGVWLQPADPSLATAWLEGKLWAAAVEEGVPVEWIRVLAGIPGRDV
jgi:hypothetical protein